MRRLMVITVLMLSAAPADTQTVEWQFTEVARFDEFGPGLTFAEIAGIVATPDGRFWVLDRLNSTVFAFDSATRFVRQLGRRGGGPGELSNQALAMGLAGDRIGVADIANARITVFDTAGAVLPGYRIEIMSGYPNQIAGLPDGTFVELVEPLPLAFALDPQAVRIGPLLLQRGSGGDILDTIAAFESLPMFEILSDGRPVVRLMPDRPVWTMSASGRVFFGRSDAYRITVWEPGQGITHQFGRAVERRAMSDRYRESVRSGQRDALDNLGGIPRNVRDALENMEFADSLPMIDEMIAGPFGAVLVGRGLGLVDAHVHDGPRNDWDVFDHEGDYLGFLQLPGDFIPMTGNGDRLYGTTTDEWDVPYVVVLRVEW